MNKVVLRGVLLGYNFKNRSVVEVVISNLLFADDTLIFCKDSYDEMTFLSWMLLWFEAISGMRINIEKSVLLSVGEIVDAMVLAMELGYKVGTLLTSYLGLPRKTMTFWGGAEEKQLSEASSFVK